MINVVTTGVILGSRHDADKSGEIVFSLSGDTHNGTNILLIIFWIINFILFIRACAKSTHKREHAQQQKYTREQIGPRSAIETLDDKDKIFIREIINEQLGKELNKWKKI